MRQMILPKILKTLRCDDIVRIGKQNDGGYLVRQSDISKTTQLLSFGIGTDDSFEQQFCDEAKCNAIAYDRNAAMHISSVSYLNIVKRNVALQSSFDSISILDIDFQEDTFLKCDIDGGEYAILDHLINISDMLSGMVIEFHDISKYEYFNEMTSFIAKTSLKLIHTHPNNYSYVNSNGTYIPDVVELSFTSHPAKTGYITLPHVLDMPNNPNDEDFELLF